MGRRYRPRKEFKFWLYRDVTLDAQLITAIGNLKTNRSFTKMIRDGLRLLWTLGEGDITVLLELFPNIAEKFERPQLAPPPAVQIDTGSIEMVVHSAVQSAMAQYTPPLLTAPVTPAPGGLKPLVGAKPIAMPTFGDEDEDEKLVVKKDENAGMRTTENFINSFMALQKAAPPKADDNKDNTGRGSRNLIENRT